MCELSEQAKAKRNEYHRKWRAANPEKWHAMQRRYWEKKAKEETATPEPAPEG